MPTIPILRRDLLDAAAKNNPEMYLVLKGLHDFTETLATATGVPTAANQDVTTPGNKNIAPPLQPQWTVTGVDGKFIITITPPQSLVPQSPTHAIRLRKPKRARVTTVSGRFGLEDIMDDGDFDYGPPSLNDQKTQILYQLQSSTTQLFDTAGSVTSYGPDPKTVWEILDPNVSKYWRIRSQFINSDWSAWYPYVDAVLCGIVTINSGLVRSSSINVGTAQNQTNNATIDSIDAGANATARVYGPGGVGTSWTQTSGTGTNTFPAGTLTGLAYASQDVVVYNTGLTTVNGVAPGGYGIFSLGAQFKNSIADSLMFVGYVTTVAGGGGGGVTGGGGPSATIKGSRFAQ